MTVDRWGARCWLLGLPLFLAANLITGLAWRDPPYSWAVHNVSDLGNVTCGRWDTTRPREVCSPWHVLANGAFVALGVLLVAGVLLTWSRLGRGTAVRSAQVATGAAAAGWVLVGAYPADVNENVHVMGALLIFALGNVGMLAAVLAPRATTLGAVRGLSLALGITGMVGCALFLARVDPGFGVGGMERVAVLPLLAWTGELGLWLLRRPRAGNR
ncbi:DUF998 domain-containing protein [Micromonospora siamensis]|uniref:Hypothetical membrane protein n=1 Tax=Micromonospora siamensis TaxID=299152 RepID=A0A1C5K5E1_9ACTN|nr:DUF998 domain-containing protein [Micromonospora siamensis]SCG77811.1 hypothetical membrane protein [Micromonospora siamensis]